jgi:hypothetical protein
VGVVDEVALVVIDAELCVGVAVNGRTKGVDEIGIFGGNCFSTSDAF